MDRSAGGRSRCSSSSTRAGLAAMPSSVSTTRCPRSASSASGDDLPVPDIPVTSTLSTAAPSRSSTPRQRDRLGGDRLAPRQAQRLGKIRASPTARAELVERSLDRGAEGRTATDAFPRCKWARRRRLGLCHRGSQSGPALPLLVSLQERERAMAFVPLLAGSGYTPLGVDVIPRAAIAVRAAFGARSTEPEFPPVLTARD